MRLEEEVLCKAPTAVLGMGCRDEKKVGGSVAVLLLRKRWKAHPDSSYSCRAASGTMDLGLQRHRAEMWCRMCCMLQQQWIEQAICGSWTLVA